MMKKSRDSKGITLIALVITVIVLLIISSITIPTLFGHDGLIIKADNAREQSEVSEVTEQAKLDIFNWEQQHPDEYVTSDEQAEQIIREANDGIKDKYYSDIVDGEIITRNGYKVKLSDFYDVFSKIQIGDYINYPVYYNNVSDDVEGTGWRVLSKEDNGCVKLISEGVPLTFSFSKYSYMPDLIYDLTENFFNIQIGKNDSYYFPDCRVKDLNGENINDITKLKDIFYNKYTQNVRSLVKGDIEKVIGTKIESYITYSNIHEKYNNLLGLKIKMFNVEKDDWYSYEYARWHCMSTFVAPEDDGSNFWPNYYSEPSYDKLNYELFLIRSIRTVYKDDGSTRLYSDFYDDHFKDTPVNDHTKLNTLFFHSIDRPTGIRLTVLLNKDVKFSKSKDMTNGTTTWDISI